MKRLRWSAAVAVVALSLGAGTGAGDDKEGAAKKELKAMEGNWQLTRQEERGSLTPKPVVDEMSWYIGNPAANQTADLKLDPTKDPKEIDAEITSNSAKDKKMLGIYKLDKDTLEICWGEPGSDKRPKKFTSRPGVGSGNVYSKYEREKDK